MTIYIDLFFLINFAVDYVILSISAQRRYFRKRRKIIISAAAGVYSCLYTVFPNSIFYGAFFKILFFVAMISALLIPCKLKEFVNGLICGILSAALICGTTYSLLLLTGFNGAAFFRMPTAILISGTVIALLIYRLFAEMSKKKLSVNGYTLVITYNKKSAHLCCEADTGNSLSEPVSDCPVIVADKKILNKLFGKNVIPGNLCEFVRAEDFKVIPYHTISSSGIMYGFVPDKVTLNSKKISKTIIAFAPEKLNTDALINPLLIQEG